MAFEFLSQLDTTTAFLLVIIFILFMFSVKKVLGILKNALIIVVASVLFPIAGSRFLGLPVPTDGGTILSFIILGLGLYFLYILGSAVYKALSYFERGAKQIPKPGIAERKKEVQKEEKEPEPVRGPPAVVGGRRTKKIWEKEYISIGDARPGKGAKPERKTKQERKKRTKKPKMEKIPVIDED